MYDLPYIKYNINKNQLQRVNSIKYKLIHASQVNNLIYKGKRILK